MSRPSGRTETPIVRNETPRVMFCASLFSSPYHPFLLHVVRYPSHNVVARDRCGSGPCCSLFLQQLLGNHRPISVPCRTDWRWKCWHVASVGQACQQVTSRSHITSSSFIKTFATHCCKTQSHNQSTPQNERFTSNANDQRPSRSPRATSTRKMSKIVRAPIPTLGFHPTVFTHAAFA